MESREKVASSPRTGKARKGILSPALSSTHLRAASARQGGGEGARRLPPSVRGYHRLVLGGVFLAKNNQSFGDGEFGQTRDAVDIQLAYDVLAVRFHGANADSQGASDFFIAS